MRQPARSIRNGDDDPNRTRNSPDLNRPEKTVSGLAASIRCGGRCRFCRAGTAHGNKRAIRRHPDEERVQVQGVEPWGPAEPV